MLKQLNDGISKVWKVHKSNDPFYSGGKVEVSADESKILCMFEDNVSMVKLNEENVVVPLFKSDNTEAEPLSCFCFHPTKDEIVVSSHKSLVSHWNISGEGCIRSFKAHQMPILSMAFDPTGTLVATGSADRTIRVWDLAGGFCTHSFRDHTDVVRTVQFHPDPQRLQVISTSDDNTLRIFDLREQKCVAVMRSHVSLPTAVSISHDGYLMASCGRDKVVNFHELREYKHIKTVPVMEELEGVVLLNQAHSAEILGSLGSAGKIGAGTHVLITAGEQGVLKFFRVDMAGKDISTFTIAPLLHFPLSVAQRSGLVLDSATKGSAEAGNLQGIASLHYMPKTGEVLSVTKDYNLCSYAIPAFKKQLALLTQARSGSQSAASDASSHERIEPSKLLIGSQGEILDMALIPSNATTSAASGDHNGSKFQLALITNSPQVRIVNEKFSCSVLEGHKDIVLCVGVSPDGEYLVTSSKDHRCLVWSVADLACVAVGEGHTDAVGSVSICHNRASYASRVAFMASGGADKILKRWALPVHTFSTSKLSKLVSTHSVRAHDKDINAVAISPNDSMIASASQDKSVRLWRASDLSPIATLNGHKRGVWKVCFSPVDKVLVSCSGDRTVKMWSVVDHSLLRTFEGHTASVLAVKFVNKGSQLVSASADGLIRVWTIRTGECESTLDVHTDRVWALECLHTQSEEGEQDTDTADDSNAKTLAETKSAGSSQQEMHFFSGGSDSKLIQWKDATAAEEMSRMELAERSLLLEQQMQNDIRNKRYDKALVTALDLGHSLKVLNILTAILEDESKIKKQNEESKEDLFCLDWSLRLDPYVQAFTDEQLNKIVTYLKDWNSNARHCYTSQVLLNSMLRVIRVEALMKHRVVLESLPALLSYTERHYQRLDRLNQASYMLEYFASMISLLPTETADITHSAGSTKHAAAGHGKVASHQEEKDELLVRFKPRSDGEADEMSEDEDALEDAEPVSQQETTSSKKKARRNSESEGSDNKKAKKSAKKRKSNVE